jgi:hypothetical protein
MIVLLEPYLAAAGTNRTRAGQFATSAYASKLGCKILALVTLPSIKGNEAVVLDAVASSLLASSCRGSWFGGGPFIWRLLFPSYQFFIVFLGGFIVEVLNLLK